MDDADIVRRIGELADEEHKLERSHEGQEPSGQDLEKLRNIEVTLDQCWDLLRQRRAAARRRSGSRRRLRPGPKALWRATASSSSEEARRLRS